MDALNKIINKIKNEELKKYFIEEKVYQVRYNDVKYIDGNDLLMKFENDLRKLYPTLFDNLARELINDSYYRIQTTLHEYLVKEYELINYKKLNNLLNYNRLDYNCLKDLYEKGYSKKYYTINELFDFINEHPKYFDVLAPIIAKYGSISDFERFNKMLLDAKLEDGIKISIFKTVLIDNENKECINYFLNKIKENNYYRMPALKDACYISYEDSTLEIKKNISIIEDAINNNYDPYLKKGFRENFYFLVRLKKYSSENYVNYLNLLFATNNISARRACFYSLKHYLRCNKKQIIISDFIPIIKKLNLEYEDFALFEDFDTFFITKNDGIDLFNIFYKLFMSMKNVNYHFKKTDDIFIASDLSKESVVKQLCNLSLLINEDKYYEMMDNCVNNMDVESLSTFITKLGDKTKIDTRKIIISFLKTDNYSGLKHYNKNNIKLSFEEAIFVSDYLKSKKETVKKNILNAYLNSEYKMKIANYLIDSKIEYKEQIGYEILNKLGLLNNDSKSYLETLDNQPNEISEILSEKISVQEFKLVDINKIRLFYDKLKDFIEENKNYEYKERYYDGLLTFGTRFEPLSFKRGIDSTIDNYPLGDKIKEQFFNILTSEEIFSVFMEIQISRNNKNDIIYDEEYYSLISNDKNRLKLIREMNDQYTRRVLLDILIAFSIELKDAKSLACSYINLFRKNKDSRFLNIKYVNNIDYNFDCFLNALTYTNDTETLKLWRYYYSLSLKYDVISHKNIKILVSLVENDLISYEYFRYFCLVKFNDISNYVSFGLGDNSDYFNIEGYKYNKFKAFVLRLFDEGIEAELNRGSADTLYTKFIHRSHEYYGVYVFIKTLYSLRKLTLVRGNSFFGTEKNVILSKILKYTVKDKNDTYEKFISLVKEYKITKEELIKGCLYNQTYIDYIDKYFNIPGFKLSIYYFIAHLNESINESKREIFKTYSKIDYNDFKDGAFDTDWYNEMTNLIPQKEFKIIYDNAKYITVAGLHKRAQRFFDAKNNLITLDECINKINETRNKDYVLIYSLIPIKSKDDLYARYIFIQDFIKESKKYGAQRQASERRVSDIALDNLARNASYIDTNLFIYEMEIYNQKDYLYPIKIDDYDIKPVINHLKINLVIEKDNKIINTLPSKLSKNEELIILKNNIKEGQNKLKRIVKSFEETMCNHLPLKYETLLLISNDTIINNVLSKLILLSNDNEPLVLVNNHLENLDGEIKVSNELFIAHPIELKKYNVLQKCINFIVKNNIKQPFKQVLREFYTKSDLELTQDDCWRFRGFNVDLKKCISALKGKGWGISEDVGLRRVYYHQNTVAILFREFDAFYTYDLTDENRELHTVSFINRKTEEAISLKDVDDITFSECLRDVDLMISISANVIYDYELAMSTTEIRQEILKSLIDILTLNNVSFLKDNIKIEGTYGSYLINIRTGLVFMDGRGNILVKTIYSSNTPILLDFIDEDPLTADIISKVIYFSNDTKIKDQSILFQITDKK